MGCIQSSDTSDEGSPTVAAPVVSVGGEVYVYVPGFRAPNYVDLTELLQGSVSADLVSRLQLLRSQVLIVSGKNSQAAKSRRRRPQNQQDTPTAKDLEKALLDYLPMLLGLVTGGEKLSSGIVFDWTNVEDEKKETALGSVYYELLSVLHLLGVLALQEANTCLTPRAPAEGYTPKATEGMCFALHPVFNVGRFLSASVAWYNVSAESKRNAIKLLLKAASYFECALRAVLPHTPDDIKAKLPADLTELMFRAMENQALGQGVELQLGFAVDNVKASLAVKRRLACEHAKVWEEANENVGLVPLADGWREKHLLFVKWKLCEAKAGAYYFHGLILDEGYEDDTHAQALTCLKAADSFMKESQKAKMDFGNAEPRTKVPPLWGHMKYLSERIPREALTKARVFRENYRKEKLPATTPQLPVFPLALTADEYDLPPVDPAWERESGYEGKHTLTSDLPAFLAKRDLNPKQNGIKSDLRRAQALSPPLMPSPPMVQAR